MAGKKELKGAEAVLVESGSGKARRLAKIRNEKKYRIREIDTIIRERRTRSEAKLLVKAAQAGIPAPRLLKSGSTEIEISFIDGEMLNRILDRAADAGKRQGNAMKKGKGSKAGKGRSVPSLEAIFSDAGNICARMHAAGICHGDYTPANLMLGKKGGLFVIDFGLGKFSAKREDFATDYLTFLKSTKDFSGLHADFEKGYLEAAGKGSPIPALAQKIDMRSRYMQRE
ncbi:MAG: KEOPS complex kinase/ATPase Bud32 [Candidatus Micrarchaeia archaeon]